jgi:hypothetical protein
MFERVRMFLRQDPLYMPYLYNEIMDMPDCATPGRLTASRICGIPGASANGP